VPQDPLVTPARPAEPAAEPAAVPVAPAPPPAPLVHDEDDPELAAWNAHLAELARRHAEGAR
jgi:hypothetical protein